VHALLLVRVEQLEAKTTVCFDLITNSMIELSALDVLQIIRLWTLWLVRKNNNLRLEIYNRACSWVMNLCRRANFAFRPVSICTTSMIRLGIPIVLHGRTLMLTNKPACWGLRLHCLVSEPVEDEEQKKAQSFGAACYFSRFSFGLYKKLGAYFITFFFEMRWAPASASIDVHNLLLRNEIFKVYNSMINKDRYKNQPSKQ
jgi:hypothetical protein